jgi:hypothetical protein
VHELGRANFVVDGQHRVALARERGAEYVDAEVTRLVTNYEVPPDVDVCELIHTEQQRIFGEQSDLAEARRRRSLRVLEASADFAAAAEDASRPGSAAGSGGSSCASRVIRCKRTASIGRSSRPTE